MHPNLNRCCLIGLLAGGAPLSAAGWRVLAENGAPLIFHGGEEKAVKGSDTQADGNPLLFDFTLTRLLDGQGHFFSLAASSTRRLFSASHA